MSLKNNERQGEHTMNRRTLTTLVVLMIFALGALTTALANNGRPIPATDTIPTMPTVSSILTPDPLHGLAHAVVSGVYNLYEQADDDATSGS
jgi:hypothetical protein